MRLHLYVRDFPPVGSRSGAGVNKAVAGLAKGFVENGARVTVVCTGSEAGTALSPDGYDIVRFKVCDRWKLRLPQELDDYIAACDRSDLFVLSGVFTPAVFAVSRACRRNGIAYVFWPHDPYHPSLFGSRKYAKWLYWRLFERRVLADAAAIQIFADQQRWLRRLGIETPCIKMANGYAAEDVLPTTDLAWHAERPERLLFVGRFDAYNKGLDILLDAFAEIAGSTGACLTLQGPHSADLPRLQRRAQALGLDNGRVVFKAPDFTRPAAQIIADHDVVLLPSRFEGFSLAALEAMCAARVLLVSEVCALSRYVRAAGCGVVVSPDAASVANGLKQLLAARPQWPRMGLAGRDYALRHFRWGSIAGDLLEQYACRL
jgi:glycosyltransferase involved in cell wall biosynthesis